MDGIKQHEMTRLTHPVRPDEVESLVHSIQMPGPNELQQLSQGQQVSPDCSLHFGLNGYIAGTAIALMANHDAEAIDITAGVGILLLSLLGTYRLLRLSIGNFGCSERCHSKMLKYLAINGVATTLSFVANFNERKC